MYLLAVPIALLVGWKLFEPEVLEKTSGIRGALPWKSLAPLLLTTLGVAIFFYTAIVKLGDILLLSGEVTPGVIGGIGAVFNIGVMLGTFLFIGLKKKSSGPKLLAIGMMFFALGYGGMGLSVSFAITVVFVLITSLGAGLLLPTMLTWVMSILPANVRGRGTGFWTGMFFLGQFVAPLVAVALMIVALIGSRGAQSLSQPH